MNLNYTVPKLVLQEARRGDPQAVEKRLQALQGIPLLESKAEALALAETFLYQQRILPKTAREDALHIAIAITGGMNYLLTWNCRHIANVELQQMISNISHQAGYHMPILCTPELLMGG